MSDRATPEGPAAWHPRSELELLRDQLEGQRAWQRAAAERARAVAAASREQRMDLHRREEALRRANDALVRRTAESAARSEALLRGAAPRAVLVHRRDWVRDKVGLLLDDRGVEVLASVSDGAEGLGAVVAEQPDLLLVEDMLPSVTGRELLLACRSFAPRTRIGVQVDGGSSASTMVDAGALAVWGRAAPPADIADGLLALVASD